MIKKFVDSLKKFNYIMTKKQKMQSIGIIILIFIGSLMELLGVSMIIPFIQAIISPDVLLEKKYVQTLCNIFHIKNDTQLIILIAVGLILVFIVKNAYLMFLSYIKAKFQAKLLSNLAINMLDSYLRQPYTYFLNINTAEVLQNISSDSTSVATMLNNMFKIVTESMTALMICIFIMVTDFIMAIGIIFVALMCFVIIVMGLRGRMKKIGETNRYYEKITSQKAYETFTGIKEIKVLNRMKFFRDVYAKNYEGKQKVTAQSTFASEIPNYIIEMLCISGLLGIVCMKISSGNSALGFLTQLTAFAYGAFRMLPSVSRITSNMNGYIYLKPGLDAVYEKLSKFQAEDMNDVVFIEDKEIGNSELQFKEQLKIENVYWKYPNSEKDTISGLSMVIKRGEAVALIGTSGAGKTTLADIILGIIKPQKGTITLDGVDISLLSTKWNTVVGYVPQTVFLTDDSVRNNIAFGIEEHLINDKEVWRALEQAQLRELIENLPDGLDTQVGERGIRFSGGQRQRIAIARALYTDPEIIILDEATAALDNDTESAVMEAIDGLHGKKTLIIVAHRLSTIENCDTVYEVKDGNVSRVRG